MQQSSGKSVILGPSVYISNPSLNLIYRAIAYGFGDPEIHTSAWMEFHDNYALPLFSVMGCWLYVDPILAATDNIGMIALYMFSALVTGYIFISYGYQVYRDFILQSRLPVGLMPYAKNKSSLWMFISQIIADLTLAAISGIPFAAEAFSDHSDNLPYVAIGFKTLFVLLANIYIHSYPAALLLRDPIFRAPFQPLIWLFKKIYCLCLSPEARNIYQEKEDHKILQDKKYNLFMKQLQLTLNTIRQQPFSDVNQIIFKNIFEIFNGDDYFSVLTAELDVADIYEGMAGHISSKIVWFIAGLLMAIGFIGFYLANYNTATDLFNGEFLQWFLTIVPCAVLAVLVAYFGGKGVRDIYVWVSDWCYSHNKLPLPFQFYPVPYACLILFELTMAWFSSITAEQVIKATVTGELQPYLVVCGAAAWKILAMSMMYKFFNDIILNTAYESDDLSKYKQVRLVMGCNKVLNVVGNLDPGRVVDALDAMPVNTREKLMATENKSVLSNCYAGCFKSCIKDESSDAKQLVDKALRNPSILGV